MKYPCLLTTTTLFVVFASLTYAAPTKSEQAEIEGWLDTFRSFAPHLKKGAKFLLDNYGEVEAQDALIQKILQVQQDELLSKDDLQGKQWIQNLLAGKLKGVAEEQGMEYMPDIENLSKEVQAQFFGSILEAVSKYLG